METYAEVAWTPGDVVRLAEQPNIDQTLTEDEAREFLAANGRRLQDRLIELGWEVMEDLLTFWLEGRAEDYRVNSMPCEPTMTALGWLEWQTGGGCTALGFNFQGDPDGQGRYLLMTVKGDGLMHPTRMAQAVDVGLYNEWGEAVECHSFESLYEFLGIWDGRYPKRIFLTLGAGRW